jgi:hypothetical protein
MAPTNPLYLIIIIEKQKESKQAPLNLIFFLAFFLSKLAGTAHSHFFSWLLTNKLHK